MNMLVLLLVGVIAILSTAIMFRNHEYNNCKTERLDYSQSIEAVGNIQEQIDTLYYSDLIDKDEYLRISHYIDSVLWEDGTDLRCEELWDEIQEYKARAITNYESSITNEASGDRQEAKADIEQLND